MRPKPLIPTFRAIVSLLVERSGRAHASRHHAQSTLQAIASEWVIVIDGSTMP
jgi:hypothetical protein